MKKGISKGGKIFYGKHLLTFLCNTVRIFRKFSDLATRSDYKLKQITKTYLEYLS